MDLEHKQDILDQFMRQKSLSIATFVGTVCEDKKAFQCDTCDYSFSHKPQLERHTEAVYEVHTIKFLNKRRHFNVIFMITAFLRHLT